MESDRRIGQRVTESVRMWQDGAASTLPGYPRRGSILSCEVSVLRSVCKEPSHSILSEPGARKQAPRVIVCTCVMLSRGACRVNSAVALGAQAA